MLINDASITGSLIVNASSSFQNIAVSGNILPGTNNVYNLGSVDKFFKEIFVSTGSINFVDNTGIKTTISSVAGGGIQIGSVQITTSSISFVDITGSVTQTIAQSSSLGSTSNFTPTASFNEYTQSFSSSVASSITSSITTISSSVTTTITTLSSSVSTSFSSSAASVTSLSSSVSASVTSLSSSLTSVNTTQNNRLSSIESASGSYSKLSGGNTFTGVQIISGSTFIAGDLIVQGSSSIQYISASSVSIGTNTINLNTNTPAVRFAGISIFDSGSNAQTASIFWDGFCNKFIYSNPSSVGYSGGMLISGPRNTGSMGEENGLTCNVLATSIGSDHISSSAIFHDPTTTCFYNSTTINSSGILTSTNLVGTICARNGVVSGSSQVDLTGTTNYASGILTRLNTVGVFSGSAQVDGTAITNKSITIAGTSTALGGTITLATMTGGSAIHSGSYLATATTTNLSEGTNLYYTDARVKTKLNAETVISGSGQVTIASTTGFGTYINQALLTTSSPTFSAVSATTFTGALSGNASTAGSSTYSTFINSRDTRSTNDQPQDFDAYAKFDFKANGTNSLSDGGSYNGVFTFRPYGGSTDMSGGGVHQMGYTTSGNIYHRYGTTNSWGSWLKLLDSSNYSGYATFSTAITSTGDITAYYSDGRLKENLKIISNPIEKIRKITGYTYNTNELGKVLLDNENDNDNKVGLIAQDLEKVLPEAVKLAPFDRDENGNSKSGENYLTIQYEKVVPLLVEAIKEQQIKIDNLTIEVENLKKPKGL